MNEVQKYFQYGKSYLIYGRKDNHQYVFNNIISTISAQYNEIFYFDASPHGCLLYDQDKVAYNNISFDIFGYFQQDNLAQDVAEQHHQITALYIDRLFSKGRKEHYRQLKSLIRSIFNSSYRKDFSLKIFQKILIQIIELSDYDTYKQLIKLLNKIDKLKVEGKNSLNDVGFKKQVLQARIKVEEYIYRDEKKTLLDDLDISVNAYNDKSIINYLTRLNENISEYLQYDITLNRKINKINYYKYEHHTTASVLVNLILESYILKQKIYPDNKKSLIILQGAQKDLHFEVYNLVDLHQYADVCYIEFRGNDLNKELNTYIPVVIYDTENKNLALVNQKLKELKKVTSGIEQYNNATYMFEIRSV